MLHAVKIVPARKRVYSITTGCEVSSIYGYRLDCSCGARGKVRATFALARLDLVEHREGIAALDT